MATLELEKVIEKANEQMPYPGLKLQPEDPLNALPVLTKVMVQECVDSVNVATKDAVAAIEKASTKYQGKLDALTIQTEQAYKSLAAAKTEFDKIKQDKTESLVNTADYMKDQIKQAANEFLTYAQDAIAKDREAFRKEIASKTRLISWSAYLVTGSGLLLTGYLLAQMFIHTR